MKILKALIGGPPKLSMKTDGSCTSILSLPITCKQYSAVQLSQESYVDTGYGMRGIPQRNTVKSKQTPWASSRSIGRLGRQVLEMASTCNPSQLTHQNSRTCDDVLKCTSETHWKNNWDIFGVAFRIYRYRYRLDIYIYLYYIYIDIDIDRYRYRYPWDISLGYLWDISSWQPAISQIPPHPLGVYHRIPSPRPSWTEATGRTRWCPPVAPLLRLPGRDDFFWVTGVGPPFLRWHRTQKGTHILTYIYIYWHIYWHNILTYIDIYWHVYWIDIYWIIHCWHRLNNILPYILTYHEISMVLFMVHPWYLCFCQQFFTPQHRFVHFDQFLFLGRFLRLKRLGVKAIRGSRHRHLSVELDGNRTWHEL